MAAQLSINQNNGNQSEVGGVKFKMPVWEVEEDIVISGISGRFPESDNIEELKQNLYEKVDMITEDSRRWKPGIFGTPKRLGKLKDISHFDALFFGIHGKQAESMDPMQRILLEATYEAIFDAGYSPNELRGRKIGVYVGSSDKSISNAESNMDLLNGYEILGMCPALMANRISFTFDFKGPSITMDTACSSTLHALNEAVLAIRTGRCDAAIVGGGNISLSAIHTISFHRLGVISQEGKCRVFDANARGYVRSETVGAVVIQKASEARRCYANILHIKLNNDGAKPEGIAFPSMEQQICLYKEIFEELEMDPGIVDYVEAHGTGTVAGDRVEANSISQFFCPSRETPLLVGSVKSNLGHAEAASGICTMAKIILSMEEDTIAPNLHFEIPNPKVPALLDGSMKVVSEPTPWKPGIVVANNYGLGGSNVSLVVKANQMEKPVTRERVIPRLTLACGRTEEAVKFIFEKIQEEKFADEGLLLVEDACRNPPSGMKCRGFALVQTPGEEIQPTIQGIPFERPPVWFLFSGMGSQWSTMAREMMKLELFAKSINISSDILRPYGVDLLHLLTEASEGELNNIVAPFVTIAAVQISLVDVVRALGIVPDGIVGHSVGEIGCAYADGCLTHEQTLLAAYWRGKSCQQVELVYGAMAAVGMSWKEAKARCPEGVFPVCHNAEDSVTISGPAETVHKFVKELTKDNVFARVVKTCDIAFHSKYVEPASHVMRKELTKVIPNPLPRSSKWVSSSVPESEWDQPQAQLSSVDYHINNLLSPVLFNEAMSKVPKDALIIEFAPHSLLQAIVRRIQGPKSIYVGLMKRGHEDNSKHFLEGIGRLYTSGLNPIVKNLYGPIPYPVPRGTPRLSSLIKWDHSNEIPTWSFEKYFKLKDSVYVHAFKGSAGEYLTGHKVDGRVIFPFMGYVWLAWKALANHLMMEPEEVPVIFEDISIYRASLLPKSGTYHFLMKYTDCDGSFKIVESGSIVATGRVQLGDEQVLRMLDCDMDTDNLCNPEKSFVLDAKNFYKEIRLRGYEYGPTFQGVLSADASGLTGHLKWDNQWVSFLDSMLQIPILCIPQRAFMLPTRVKSIRIDPTKKPEATAQGVPFFFNPHINVSKAGPVEIHGVQCGIAPKRKNFHGTTVLEEQVFFPLFDSCVLNEKDMDSVEKYSHACSTLAHKILKQSGKGKAEISSIINGFRDAPDELLEKYYKSEDKSHVLFKILEEIQEASANSDQKIQVKDIFDANKANFHEDLLSTVILKENALRPSLDIVSSNFHLSKMKILEVSWNMCISNDVLKMLRMTTLGLAKYTYTVARISGDTVPLGMVNSTAEILECSFKEESLPTDFDLVIAKDLMTDSCCTSSEALRHLTKSVKENGFIILVERLNLSPAERFLAVVTDRQRREQKEDDLEEAIKRAGLKLVSKRKDQVTSVMYVLRKLSISEKLPELDIIHAKTNDFEWVNELKNKMKDNEINNNEKRIWIVTDCSYNGIVGFVNCLSQELGSKNIRYFFDVYPPSCYPALEFNTEDKRILEIIRQDLVVNIVKNGQLGMYGHRLLENMPDLIHQELSYLNITKRGDLSSFKWIESSTENTTMKPGHERNTTVHIYYSAINFKDVMLASGKLPPNSSSNNIALKDCLLGLEFVGRDSRGRRVMGTCLNHGMATQITVPEESLFEVPESWSLEDACTVPVAYLTSYYALFTRGNMKKGESILIHAGSGGVGQAAIAIALGEGCEVFTTVGSEEKREFLKQRFPGLDDRHISDSRDVRFEFDIMNVTKGQGVDLVLNSLADDKLQASIRCLKTNGRFLEIGKYDMAMNNPLGMSAFLKNLTFHGVFLDSVLETVNDSNDIFGCIKRLFLMGIQDGVVKPLNRTVYRHDQAEAAFRYMATGKHTGKVLLKIREEEPNRNAIPVPILIPSVPRMYCHPSKSYLVTGGLGGFGFELAGWLIERGAKYIVLSSRTGVKNDYQRLWIERWKMAGVQVTVCNQDISSRDACKELLEESCRMVPLGGLFHLAMVLHDSLFENLKPEDFAEVCNPKARGLVYLDEFSRSLCPSLDHFVVFSSISCGRGNPGQSNYGFANSVMERVVEQRKSLGLPGLAIQWGGIGDVGVVYENMGGNEVVLKGTVPQRLNSCLEVLDRFMRENKAVVSSFVPVEKTAFSTDSNQDIVALLCNVLGIKDPSSVKPEMTLGELGMDSLMGVEIKQTLESDYDTVLTVPEVRQLSIKELEGIGKTRSNKEPNSPTKKMDRDTAVTLRLSIPEDILTPLNNVKGNECVFFIHPIEGHTNALKPLARKIKKPVYGVQYTDKVPSETVQEMATCYIKHMKEHQPQGPYHLVGYSYGAMVAFEMALQLQKTDQVKTFISLDGSPSAVVELAKAIIKDNSKDNYTVTGDMLMMFLKQCLSQIPLQLEELVRNLTPGPDGISKAVEMMKHLLGQEVDEGQIRESMTRWLELKWAAKRYIPGEIFRGRATLVKADLDASMEDVEGLGHRKTDDYHLSEVVDGSLEILTVKILHTEMGDDHANEISKIINDRL